MLDGNVASFTSSVKRLTVITLARQAGFRVEWAGTIMAIGADILISSPVTAGELLKLTAMNDGALLWLQMNHEG